MTDTARRDNQGKVDYTLLPLDALEEEARVWMAGEIKYGRYNWEKLWGEDTPRVSMASALRHIFAYLGGEEYDPETGLHHLAHARCNCAMGIRHTNNNKNSTGYDNESLVHDLFEKLGDGFERSDKAR